MPKFKPINPWNAEQEAWILKRLARMVTQAAIFRMLSGEEHGRPDDVPIWEGNYCTFRKRISVLTAGNSNIKRAQNYKEANKSQGPDPSPVDISGIDAQVTWLSTFITSNTGAKPNDRLKAMQMLRDLQDRVDKNDPEKAEDDGFTLLGNAKCVKLDAGYLIELIMTFRDEFGGLHKLPLDTLHLKELTALIKEALQVHKEKTQCDGLPSFLKGVNFEAESRNEKLRRLRHELQSLTKPEVEALEKGKDLGI